MLGTHEESIAGLPWQIVVPKTDGSQPRAKDKRAAQWCESVLRSIPGMTRLIADIAGAYYYGFSVDEIIWRRLDGRLVPDRFAHVAARRMRFRIEDGTLILWDNGGNPTDLREKHPNKFVIAQPRANGDLPNREGLCRPLVWMSVMRRWAIGDWLHTGEMSWKPWRIGKYKQATAGSKDKEDLENILRRMTTDFTAVIPDSTEIAIEWPGGTSRSGSTHGEIVNVLGQEISKAVLGQTETTQASQSSGYAQAKVHDEVRRDLRESRAREVAAILTRDLVEVMIRLNFGDSVQTPRFEFVTREAVDIKALSEAVLAFVGTGLKVPQKWVRDEAGIPEPRAGEEVLELPEKEPAAVPGQPAATPGKPGDPNATETPIPPTQSTPDGAPTPEDTPVEGP